MGYTARHLIDKVGSKTFSKLHNDMEKFPNQEVLRGKLEEKAGFHVGKQMLLSAISIVQGENPSLLISRRQHYDEGRTKAAAERKATKAASAPAAPTIEPQLEHRLVLENRRLRKEVLGFRNQEEQNATFLKVWEGLNSLPVDPPRWLMPKARKKKTAIPTAFLSDCHFDEVVSPREINFVNGYNREIAQTRLQRFGDSTIRLCRDYSTNLELKTLVMPWGGDMVGGNIHEELKKTNEDDIMGTVNHWIVQLVALVEQMLTYFDEIFIPCVVGNHGRNSHKPIAKGRVRDNFDWLLYKQVEFFFHGTVASRKRYKNVTFQISDGTECRYQIYSTRYQLTHGDQFRGGQGWGGLAVPIMKGHHKKQQREQDTGTPFDIMLLGHFHQLRDFGNCVVNGSLKGYDEYAALFNFGFEVPKQAFFLTDPERGKTMFTPIHVGSDDEDWKSELQDTRIITTA